MGNLSVADYIVIVGMQIFCAVAGLILGGKGPDENTVENFILGERIMPPVPVGFSLVATTLSAVAMSGGLGEIYFYGVQYAIIKVAASFSCLMAMWWIAPVFHQYKFVTLQEYIGMRFGQVMRILYSIIYLLGYILYLGAVMYVPAMALSVVTNFPFWISVTVAGSICIFYCFVGGMRAIIWTDALQLVFMLLCFVVVIIQGSINLGGAGNVIKAATRGARLQTFTLKENHSTRYSVWSIILNGIVLSVSTVCASQAGVQRLLCVHDYKDVKKVLWTSAGMTLLFAILLAGASVVVYAAFENCDPILDSKASHPDELLVYFIQTKLESAPGLKGLAVGGIFCGSLSSLSSYINSFAAVGVEDLVRVIWPKKANDEVLGVRLAQFFTLAFGIIVVGLTFVVDKMGGVTDVFQSVVGAAGGPLLGVLCLGIYVQRVEFKSAVISMFCGLVVTIWIAVGASVSDIQYAALPVGDCGKALPPTKTHFGVDEVFPLYRMSSLWYGPLGFLITTVVGFLISRFIKNSKSVDSRLLSPIATQGVTLPAGDTNRRQEMQKQTIGVTLTTVNSTTPERTSAYCISGKMGQTLSTDDNCKADDRR